MRIHLRCLGLVLFSVMACGAPIWMSAQPSAKSPPAKENTTTSSQESDLRFQGEQRFRTNCSRCHTAPHKFPPRMMATIIRHMRVRATLTDEDMRLILRYMTQ
jgi:mono/diheme cytochrome c family protein